MERVLKRCAAVLFVSGLCVSGARADGWSDLGGALQAGCNVSNGIAVGPIQLGGDANLQWLCTLRSMYGFVSDSILGGDWVGFAGEVIGRYATDLASHVTDRLGLGTIDGWVNRANDALLGNYGDFRLNMMTAMRDALERDGSKRPDPSSKFSLATAGGLASYYTKINPLLNAARASRNIAETARIFEGMDLAHRADVGEQELKQSIEQNVAPALASAAQMVGTPVKSGIADDLLKKGQTALSMRELMETQLEAQTTALKQNAVLTSAVLNLLSENARQGLMTNNQLMLAKGNAERQAETALSPDAALEQFAQERLNEAENVNNQFSLLTRNLRNATSPTVKSLDWSVIAP
jgi:hypothetical protein